MFDEKSTALLNLCNLKILISGHLKLAKTQIKSKLIF